MSQHWHIITGEYAPRFGGLADHTHLLATHLKSNGYEVTVYAPVGSQHVTDVYNVVALSDHFGIRGLLQLSRLLKGCNTEDRILVQYVPHMYGKKGMNLPFTFWLKYFSPNGYTLYVHEVHFPILPKQSWKHRLLAVVQRHMAKQATLRASSIVVTVPRWESVIRNFCRPKAPFLHLPVPSNIPESHLSHIRSDQFSNRIGIFGTFPTHMISFQKAIIEECLSRLPKLQVLLIGKDSSRLYEQLAVHVRPRVESHGIVSDETVANLIHSCDAMLQIYADGVSCRRTTTMACLALGRPIMTNLGDQTEGLWKNIPGVFFHSSYNPSEYYESIVKLYQNRSAFQQLSDTLTVYYQQHFSWQHTIQVLTAN